MTRAKRILWPVGAGILGAGLLTFLYFGIVSWAESPAHALDLFWEDRWIVIPIILGFGVQAARWPVQVAACPPWPWWPAVPIM